MAQQPTEISPTELNNLLEANLSAQSMVLVDCREQEERDVASIVSSLHLPMSKLPEGLEVLEGKQQTPLVVYCHHGVRSQNVAAWLAEQGYADVRSLAGGIDAWAVQIEPEMARY